jgi:hypothetical protein
MRSGTVAAGMAAVILVAGPVGAAQPLPPADVHALFAQAERENRVGLARKTKPVDARPRTKSPRRRSPAPTRSCAPPRRPDDGARRQGWT